jgi:hypothetical protein
MAVSFSLPPLLPLSAPPPTDVLLCNEKMILLFRLHLRLNGGIHSARANHLPNESLQPKA